MDESTQEQYQSEMTSELRPRRYQEEVFDRAQKENIIAALQTGAGKTLISLLLIKWILTKENSREKAIIFLVPRVALVEQQANFLQRSLKDTSVKIMKLHGMVDIELTNKAAWRRRFTQNQIFVMTPQILLNLLTHGLWNLKNVSLLVFDECHNARKNHPYVGIMREYAHLPVRCRPKVFGMTASPIWDTKNPEHSLTALESIMDSKIVGVRENLQELADHSPKATEIVKQYPCPPEKYDYPSPTLWDYVQVFYDANWEQLGIGWNNFEGRYLTTLNSLGPFAASWFLYHELDHYLVKHLRNRKPIIDAMDIDDDHPMVTPTPSSEEFEIIGEIHHSFRGFFADDKSANIPITQCTPKVKSLVEVLSGYITDSFKCIVFVEQRHIAACLSMMLPRLSELQGKIRTACLLGQGVDSDGVSRTTHGAHKNAVKLFREGQANLLVATSVAEEGLDFPECDLVVRFDSPQHMVGYVQSRGRARKKSSTFVVMIQEDDIARLAKYQKLRDSELEVAQTYQTRHDPLQADQNDMEVDEEDDIDPTDVAARERYVVQSTGAVLTYDNSIQLIQYLCSLIPRDPFTPPHHPKFSGDFSVTMILPSAIPVSAENLTFIGPIRKSKKEAKRAVAFRAVQRLHELDVFDNHLLPTTSLKDEELGEHAGNTSLAKWVPEMMNVHVKDPWTTGPDLWIQIVSLEERPVAALLTGTMLPPVQFEHSCGRVSTSTSDRLCSKSDEDGTWKRKIMCEYTRRAVWIFNTGRPWPGEPSCLLVPITEDNQVDFPAMESVLEQNPIGSFDWSLVTPKDYDNLLVMNANAYGRLSILRNIRTDLTPMSVPPCGSIEDGFATYYDYFADKWARKSTSHQPYLPQTGPMIEIVHTGRSYNGLYPLHGSVGQGQEFTVRRGQLLPQGCCRWLPISMTMYKAYTVLPSLCHRATDVYRAKGLKLDLGLPPIHDDFVVEALTLPCSNSGFSNQRLETLGDAVLELCTTVYLFNRYPHRHEGQLSTLRAKVISNRFLLAKAKEVNLEDYLTSEMANVHVWRYTETRESAENPHTERRALRQFPRRSLQDCMEALLGASFLTGGIPMALQSGTALGVFFGGSTPWNYRFGPVPQSSPTSVLLSGLEDSLGYKFRRGELLLEAITHPSFSDGPSYQRLEFLGDAILDLVVIHYLYRKFPKATSHELAFPRTKAICAPALAFLAVKRLNIEKIMLVNLVELTKAIDDYAPLLKKATGAEMVRRGWRYDPPKPLSDVFEAVIGAVLIDSGYDYERTAAVVEYVMEDILVELSPSVLKDPVSELTNWTAAEGCCEISFKIQELTKNGVPVQGTAAIVHDITIAGPIISASQAVAKFVAAERALSILKNDDHPNSLAKICRCKENKGSRPAEPTDEDLLEEAEVEEVAVALMQIDLDS